MENIIVFEIGTILIIATLFAYAARFLRQPLIPAYIFAGLLIGPILGLVTKVELIRTLSEIGIAFLLFIVGLEIEFKRLKNVAQVATLGSLIKMAALFFVGFIMTRLIGYDAITAVYLGFIIAFSSTMVVIKLLSDKSELDTLHGRIVLGTLLMEDFIAIIALAMLTNATFSIDTVINSVLKIVFMLIVLFFANVYMLPHMFRFAAKTKELLFLASISVLFFFSIFAMYLDVSLVIGAFIAGVALANLPYNIEIIGKVMSLKDFFSIIFFVSIGMSIAFDTVRVILIPLAVFLAIVLLLKPFLMMSIATMFGYKKRPAFLSAVSLAQISEFALILAASGMFLGHISREIYTMTILLALLTMGLTSYVINYDHQLYSFFSKWLDVFETILPHKKYIYEFMPKSPKYDVILCGHNRVGYSILKAMKKLKKKIVVIDFNPEIIKELMAKRIPCLYGDVGDMDVLKRLDFKEAKIVVSTVPDRHDNLLLLQRLKEVNSKAITFTTSTSVDDALDLYEKGSDYVILPHFLGGEHAAFLINDLTADITKVIKHRTKHIKELRHRKLIGHDYPPGLYMR